MTTIDLTPYFNEINEEAQGAIQAHGLAHSSHEAFAILKEEVDETWDEVRADNYEKQRAELVQVASCAIKYMLMLDQKILQNQQKQMSIDLNPS